MLQPTSRKSISKPAEEAAQNAKESNIKRMKCVNKLMPRQKNRGDHPSNKSNNESDVAPFIRM